VVDVVVSVVAEVCEVCVLLDVVLLDVVVV
jgi:hypothetical protein